MVNLDCLFNQVTTIDDGGLTMLTKYCYKNMVPTIRIGKTNRKTRPEFNREQDSLNQAVNTNLVRLNQWTVLIPVVPKDLQGRLGPLIFRTTTFLFRSIFGTVIRTVVLLTRISKAIRSYASVSYPWTDRPYASLDRSYLP